MRCFVLAMTPRLQRGGATWRSREQLCAMIDKCLKRLLIVRGLEPISATLSSVISAANCRSSKSA